MTQVATTGKVTTSIENVSVEHITDAVDHMSRSKGGSSSSGNGVMSSREILDLGISPCELNSWVATWTTLGGQASVRESVTRKLSDLEIC